MTKQTPQGMNADRQGYALYPSDYALRIKVHNSHYGQEIAFERVYITELFVNDIPISGNVIPYNYQYKLKYEIEDSYGQKDIVDYNKLIPFEAFNCAAEKINAEGQYFCRTYYKMY